MAKKLCTDEEFVQLFESLGAQGAAKVLGYADPRAIFNRRARIEKQLGILIKNPFGPGGMPAKYRCGSYDARVPVKIDDGVAVVFSDPHYWPDVISTAHRGLRKLLPELKPRALICNGDAIDGARISRHPPLGFSDKPEVSAELDAVDERLLELAKASGKQCNLFWNVGNHDLRFEARLSAVAPEFKNVEGFTLADHFAAWSFGMSVWINGNVVVKHRYKSGIHATHNNTVAAGLSIVTGHLHSLKVTPFDDYNGTRWGVDTGTLADPFGEHTDYMEDNPRNHRSGFVVLTFRGGRLLWPDVAYVVDERHIGFRGQLLSV